MILDIGLIVQTNIYAKLEQAEITLGIGKILNRGDVFFEQRKIFPLSDDMLHQPFLKKHR